MWTGAVLQQQFHCLGIAGPHRRDQQPLLLVVVVGHRHVRVEPGLQRRTEPTERVGCIGRVLKELLRNR